MPKRLKITKGFLNNQSINEVIGLNIAYSNSNYGAENFPSAYSLYTPQGIAFDAFGNLWAVDALGYRIVMYPPQNQFNGQPATFVIGQSNLNTHANFGISQTSFDGNIYNIAFDKNNNLWINDGSTIRGFEYPFGSGGILTMKWMLGSNNWADNGANSGSARALSLTTAGNSFCFDNNNVMWVADYNNNRVLGFKPEVFYGSIGGNASYVIGQPNFTSNAGQTLSANSLSLPISVAIDKNGYLWVLDYGNFRVLGYKNPQSIMPAADYVIGQPNFTTSSYAATQNQLRRPMNLAFDNLGNLWVYDYYRILGFASADLYGNNQPNASWLMFQTSYTAELTSTLSQQYTTGYDMSGFFYSYPVPNEEIVTVLPNPYQIDYGMSCYLAFNSENDMWISDIQNYRILQYKNSDITSNAYPYNCSAVLGQSQFYIQGTPGQTQYDINLPTDVAFDKNNNLWVSNGYAAYGFEYPNYSQQVMKNWAIGGSFTAVGGLTQNGVTNSYAVSFDNFGNMYVSDSTNNRVVGYLASVLYGNNEPNAFVVIGQPNFTTGTAATTQSGLTLDGGYYGKVAFDSNNNMYVADAGNSRIMIFPYGSGFTNGMNASVVLGQPNFTTNTQGSTAAELNYPKYVILDKAGNLYVADMQNNRVQIFVPPFTTGMSATISITGFNSPQSLVFDKLGNLLVNDAKNNRILGFPPSALTASTTVSSATIVLGQPNFTATTAGLGITAINTSSYGGGMAINPETGDLIFVDEGNFRIVSWYYQHKQTQTNALDSKYIFYNE